MILLFLLFISADDLLAEETTKKSGKTKILVGVGLMAGGGALAIHGGSNIFQEGGDVEFLSGIGIFGEGAVLTILGIREKSRSKNELSTSWKEEVEAPLDIQFIAGPTRKGITAGMTFKW
ncbi:hypothetical protein L0244_04340 [bacterium]|nr:hypothetical protein [bacterium]